MFKIVNSTLADKETIQELYKIARAYQKSRYKVVWPMFEDSLIIHEIKNKHQWKLLINNEIACVWATTHTDALIWGEKDKQASVYIHRIATNPNFRGQHLVQKIVDWSVEYAKKNNLEYVRLDTVGENKKLIAHYKKCGFSYLGLYKIKNTNSLPAHYKLDDVALFEIKL